MKIVLSGYYGFDNCGDEAVLLSILHCLRKLSPDVQVTVLSGNPEKTREIYGVSAVNRWNLATIVRELVKADLLISGGGSLIQDVTSVRSPSYYLGIIRIALFLRKKVMIYAQGIGPLVDEKNRVSAAKVFNRCGAITVRDKASANLLREIGVGKELHVTCDPVMALSRNNVSIGIVSELLLELGISGADGKKKKPALFVSMRRWKDDRHFEQVAIVLDEQAAAGWDIILVPAHFPDDVEAIYILREKLKCVPIVVEKCLSAREFLALMLIADRVFSMRLHGLICAFAVGTPMVGLSYDPKVDAFMEQAGCGDYCLSYDDEDLANNARLALNMAAPPQDGGINITDPLPLTEIAMHRLRMQKLAWENAKIAINLTQ